jgi:type I restriction enzyme M protein
MSEELLQRGLILNPDKIGKWDFYCIGATTVKSLKENNIIHNFDYGEVEKKKVDGLIVQRKKVIAVIEYKRPSEFNTRQKQDKAIKQEVEVAKKLGSKLLIATDTQESIWVNALTGERIKDETGQEITSNFDPKDEKLPELIEKINYSINADSNKLKPKQLVNPTDLARQIWQDIWSVSGATPENCLYTFVELFIFKYLSDLGVLRGTHSFYKLIDMYGQNTEDEVLEHYADTVRKKVKQLFPDNPTDHTTIINGTIFVSKDQKAVNGYSRVFRRVLERFERYPKLEHIDYDFKSRLFESFLKESISKKNWGQFFTPLKVVRAIVEMAKEDVKEGARICDPACGVGKFLLEPIKDKVSRFFKVEKNEIRPLITIRGFDKGFDKDEQKTIILAKANMLIYFSDLLKENANITEKFSKLFNETFTLKTNSILGTLSEPIENEYDLILTNPPYVTSGSSNLKEEIRKDGELLNYYKVNALGVEGLFMEWIVKSLKPAGKAYVVIPDGILNRQNDKTLRKYITTECFIDGIISLPLNTFFTTNKKTYILCLTKKTDKRQVQTDPVFTYLVSEIGETRDVYRFDIDQNDLSEAVTLYSFFRGDKNRFTQRNDDTRCKIVPFDFFESNIELNWVIDRLWSEAEKINLGILEKNESVSLFEFSSIIEDVADTIKGLQEEVKELAEKKRPELTYQSFQLKNLFSVRRGQSKYTKKYGNTNKGSFPVYSASNHEPLTFIDTYDFDGDFLTWATNGFAGFIKVISGKFSINADRGLLEPLDNSIDIFYVKQKLEPILRGLAKGRKGDKGKDEFTKLYPSMIENIDIPMPVDSAGKIDLEAQREIVEQSNAVIEINQTIEGYKKRIDRLLITVEKDFADAFLKTVSVSDILDSPPTNSGLKKKDVASQPSVEHKIPVYSATMEEDLVFGWVAESSKWKKYQDILTWNKDGSSGYVFYRRGRFVPYEKVKLLKIKDEYRDVISYEYLKNVIEARLLQENFGFNNKCSMAKVLKILVPIPTTPDGTFNLSAQNQIAEKYSQIKGIKAAIIQKLERVSGIRVAIE